MEVQILEDSKEKLKIEVKGENHTLLNAVRKELWNDEHIKLSGYNMGHPLIPKPVLVVETDGKETARKALKDAIKRLSKSNDQLISKIKALKI
ncbi:MAG: DNA-directed RNA polymerase subunit L [Candidatus Woesearchaeota archaeon]|nr:MAG: DNA-directed RNA polymerase subunit L [Candidatus Woesearchaeota archaeon]